MKRGPGRPRKEKLVEYGPKRRRGRPRKAVDYVSGYIPPLFDVVQTEVFKKERILKQKPFGPKRKRGRPKKQLINTQLEEAILQEKAAKNLQSVIRKQMEVPMSNKIQAVITLQSAIKRRLTVQPKKEKKEKQNKLIELANKMKEDILELEMAANDLIQRRINSKKQTQEWARAMMNMKPPQIKPQPQLQLQPQPQLQAVLQPELQPQIKPKIKSVLPQLQQPEQQPKQQFKMALEEERPIKEAKPRAQPQPQEQLPVELPEEQEQQILDKRRQTIAKITQQFFKNALKVIKYNEKEAENEAKKAETAIAAQAAIAAAPIMGAIAPAAETEEALIPVMLVLDAAVNLPLESTVKVAT